MAKTHEIKGDLHYYYDFIANVDQTRFVKPVKKLHFHTYENDSILNLYMYITDLKMAESLEYVASKCTPCMDLDITPYIREFDEAMIY